LLWDNAGFAKKEAPSMSVRRFLIPILALAAFASACAGTSPSSPTLAPAEQPVPTPGPGSAGGLAATEPVSSGLGEAAVFQIDPTASEVRFVIDEVLNGSPNTVTGTTQVISGVIQVDPSQPSLSIVGPITVDAASLATDNNLRNGAIRRFILQANDFPEIVFVSTAVEGLPAPATAGETYSFSLTGDLTIRDITRPVTFEVTITVESNDRLTGSANATIQRSDFDLDIPSVPQVAEVSSDVILEIDFSAARSG
jgi:polyisoprenoid-binding protein YceI